MKGGTATFPVVLNNDQIDGALIFYQNALTMVKVGENDVSGFRSVTLTNGHINIVVYSFNPNCGRHRRILQRRGLEAVATINLRRITDQIQQCEQRPESPSSAEEGAFQISDPYGYLWRINLVGPAWLEYWRHNANVRMSVYTLCGIGAVYAGDRWLPPGDLKDFCGVMRKEMLSTAKKVLIRTGSDRVARLLGGEEQAAEEEAGECLVVGKWMMMMIFKREDCIEDVKTAFDRAASAGAKDETVNSQGRKRGKGSSRCIDIRIGIQTPDGAEAVGAAGLFHEG
ncbi:hypothetical protein FNV43_RR08938 [Rhamnella rubrinervis]|uniref:Uncharacterized protein n=1 Tax=Rhamnella rubrinervis TaxID=2594499 RepID=A0A8K0H9K0_9ROSA|nr:hypothetical protein FNV43_RR08938 [Rhamnella rubrinervis]